MSDREKELRDTSEALIVGVGYALKSTCDHFDLRHFEYLMRHMAQHFVWALLGQAGEYKNPYRAVLRTYLDSLDERDAWVVDHVEPQGEENDSGI